MKDARAKRNLPKILLVSGIFPPDVGGPATHVSKLATHLHARGFSVTVLAFGEASHTEPFRVLRVKRRAQKMFMWCEYAWKILRETPSHDVLYAFDLTTAGIPTALCARMFGKPFLLRIGGDPIWERLAEYGKVTIPMRSYYDQGCYKNDKPFLFASIKFVVQSARTIVVYCSFIKEVYQHHYSVPEHRFLIVPNPIPEQQLVAQERNTRTFIFAGRFVAYKNLERVVRVFLKLHSRHPQTRLLLIGDGPEEKKLRQMAHDASGAVTMQPRMSHTDLQNAIASASVAVAPALSEFNPNFILESIAKGKPAIISQDNGLSVRLPESWQFNPLSDDELEHVMNMFVSEEEYAQAQAILKNIPMDQTWDMVLSAHEHLIRKTLTQS